MIRHLLDVAEPVLFISIKKIVVGLPILCASGNDAADVPVVEHQVVEWEIAIDVELEKGEVRGGRYRHAVDVRIPVDRRRPDFVMDGQSIRVVDLEGHGELLRVATTGVWVR